MKCHTDQFKFVFIFVNKKQNIFHTRSPGSPRSPLGP